jgi:hypothetical protein
MDLQTGFRAMLTREELIARIGRDTALKSGDRATITLDTSAIHFFDPVTTKAVAWGA